MLKGAQRQLTEFRANPIYRTHTTLGQCWHYLTSAGASWHALSCFLSTRPTIHLFSFPFYLFFFFNEIGQLDKGQMTKLKHVSLSLARGSFTRRRKPWASTNRTDESVGEKKHEKDKAERVYHCYSVTDDTYKEVRRDSLISALPFLRYGYRHIHLG